MPLDKYITVTIGDIRAVIKSSDDIPVSIDFALEDPENFQEKKSAEALDLTIPATLLNDKAGNTFRNPDIEDLTAGEVFRSSQPCIIESSGQEIFVGKAFLIEASHTIKPEEYKYNLFGDNAGWIVDLAEKTLYDFLYQITFGFTKANIIDSWQFDGTDETLPYVFAPVRYKFPMGGYTVVNGESKAIDDNMLTTYMKPSLSKYFILFWAFKSLGYRIQSNFLDSEYFRRQVMPWTWGNFLDASTIYDPNNFLAKSVKDVYYELDWTGEPYDGYFDLDVSNDSTDGAFDNNNVYNYDTGTYEMQWTYLNSQSFGLLEATFKIQMYVKATLYESSILYLSIRWFVNDTAAILQEDVLVDFGKSGGYEGNPKIFFKSNVNPGDVVIAKIYLKTYGATTETKGELIANVLAFDLEYVRIPLDGTIDFSNYTGFKNYKVLDYIRGVIDEFNLSLNTDAVNKVVYAEPTHPYSLTSDLSARINPGYFVDDFIDWNNKADFSKKWVMTNYSDSEREVTFKYKEDGNDGILKLVQDRNINLLGAGKYVFPEKFKAGKKDVENRFFSPTMHYDVDQWKNLSGGGIAPQMVCLIPENISNTSAGESDNTFQPKSCYYKGLVTDLGLWKFDGDIQPDYPFMFSVNYKRGGDADPILSYSDENINGVKGFGLLKRFYWQRYAIMRNGQWYSAWFRLKNIDVASLHREYKSFRGQRWELIKIDGYKPLKEESCSCIMRKWAPITQKDDANTYPSHVSVINGAAPPTDSFDLKYGQLKCLITDIPTVF